MVEWDPSVEAQVAKLKPALSMSEAEEATGASRSAINRRLAAGELPNAWRDDRQKSRPWRFPIVDLEAAGFTVRKKTPADAAGNVAPLHGPAQQISAGHPSWPIVVRPDLLDAEGGEVARLHEQLAAERQRREAAEARAAESDRRREVAEAVAAERDRHMTTLQTAMRVLEASTPARNDPEGSTRSPRIADSPLAGGARPKTRRRLSERLFHRSRVR